MDALMRSAMYMVCWVPWHQQALTLEYLMSVWQCAQKPPFIYLARPQFKVILLQHDWASSQKEIIYSVLTRVDDMLLH